MFCVQYYQHIYMYRRQYTHQINLISIICNATREREERGGAEREREREREGERERERERERESIHTLF